MKKKLQPSFNDYWISIVVAFIVLVTCNQGRAQGTFVYSFQFGTAGTGNGQFSAPGDMAINSDGTIFVLDAGNKRVAAFDPSGVFLFNFGSVGTGDGQFTKPYGIAIDQSDNVYVSDATGTAERIEVFSKTGTYLRKFGSSGTGTGQFRQPRNLAFDINNDLYVVDRLNKRILVFNTTGTFLRTFASSFTDPNGLAIDDLNRVYVTDETNKAIYFFSTTGTFINQLALFYFPVGLTVDKGGNIYISESGRSEVRIYNNSLGNVAFFGSGGSANGQFNLPTSLGTDKMGKFFVADAGNARVQALTMPLATINNFADISKTYTDAAFSLAATSNSTGTITYQEVLDPLMTGDVTITGSSVSIQRAGSVKIRATVSTAGNFIATSKDIILTISKAPLTVQLNDQARPFGQNNSTFTFTYTGLKIGETSAVIDTKPTVATTANITSPVGTYVGTPVGGADDNYFFSSYVNGTITVDKLALTVSVDPATRSYGDANPTFVLTYTGFRAGDNAASIDVPPTATTTAVPSSNFGNYPITLAGGLDDTYTFTFQNSVLTINKSILNASADPISRSYGDPNPTLSLTYTGFKNGDTDAVLDTPPTVSCNALITSNANTYTITVSGGSDNNYAINNQAGVLTITKAPLTVVANPKTRQYGDPNPGFTFAYSGFKNGQNNGNLLTVPDATTTATLTSNVGTYAIAPFGGSSPNYTFIYQNGLLTINQSTVTIKIDSKTRDYGDINPANTFSYTGLKNGDDPSVVDVAPVVAVNAPATKAVGVYSYNLVTAASDNNYFIDYEIGTLTITRAPLTVTAQNKTRLYGDINPAFTLAYTGFKNGETSAVIDTPPSVTTSALTGSAAGTYPININTTNGNDDNYSFAVFQNGTLTIDKAPLTVKADDKSRSFGIANPPFTFSYVGFKNGDTENSLNTAPIGTSTATTGSNIGTYPIVPSGAISPNYSFAYQNGALTINQAAASMTLSNLAHSFDNTAKAATVTTVPNGLSGVSIVYKQGATVIAAPTAIGNYDVEATLNNPNFTAPVVTGTLVISNKPSATIGNFTDLSKTYGDPLFSLNATANSTGAITYSKVGGTGDVTLTGNNVTIVKAGTVTLRASVAGDANFAAANKDITLTIEKALLTATSDNKSRAYGDPNPTLTVTLTGFKNGETQAVIGTMPTQATIPTNINASTAVGVYGIDITSDVTDENYRIGGVAIQGALTITKAPVLVKADNKTRVYADANPTLSLTYSGFKNGETIASLITPASLTTSAIATSNVGSYNIIPGGAVSGNYNFTYQNGALNITKASLSITAENKTRTYGDADPAFTYVYSGFKNGETSAVIDTPPTLKSLLLISADAGNYLNVIVLNTAAVDNNYDVIAFTAGQMTIEKALLTASADDKTRKYGNANPVLTVTLAGFKNGETQSVIGTLPTLATTPATISPSTDVGVYKIDITSDVTDENYTIGSSAAGTFTITQAILNVQVDPKTRFYGDPNPEITFVYTGLKNGETAAVIDTAPILTYRTSTTGGVGVYPNDIAVLSFAVDNNYSIPNVFGGTLTIAKAPLTITTNNQTREYGDTDPELTFTYSGFKNGETSAVIDTQPTLRATTSGSSNAGAYASSIVISTPGADNNYDLTNFMAGDMIIAKATLTIKADDYSRPYSNLNPVFSFTYSGFKNNETSSTLMSIPVASTTATQLSSSGTYDIVPSQAAALNYSFVYQNGTLTIGKVALTVTAEAKTRVYGDANPIFTLNYRGFVNGESVSDLLTAPEVSTTTTSASNVGTYDLMVTGGTATNYSFTYQDGTLTIDRAPLIVKAHDKTRKYKEVNPALTLGYVGFKNSEDASVIDTEPTVSTNADVNSNVGNYTITAAGGDDNNYEFLSYEAGVLNITKASQIIIVQNINDKNINEPEFHLQGNASSGFAIVYTVTGPATLLSGDIVRLDGTEGTVVIKANQSGDTNYEASEEVVITFDVNTKESQIITFAALTARKLNDGNLSLVASASSGLPIIFSSSDNSIVEINGAEAVVKRAGTVNITASQAGNDLFNDALGVTQTLVINKGEQVIAFSALGDHSLNENSLTLNGSSSAGLEIVYTSSNLDVATVAGNVLTFVGVGSTSISANQSGNDNYEAALAVIQLLRIKNTQTITFRYIPEQVVGNPAFDVNANATSGLIVIFTSSDPSVATIIGKTVTIVGAGTTLITASQVGNDEYQPAQNVEQILIVNRKPQTITFNALDERILEDGPFMLDATSTSNLPLSFASSNTQVATISGSTITLVGAGETVITASNNGNAEYNEAVSIQQTLIVKLITGNIEYDLSEETKVYPNPARDYIVIDGKYLSDNFSIMLNDTKGVRVMDHVLISPLTDRSYKVNLSSLSAGVYVLKINTGKNVITKRIVKQ